MPGRINNFIKLTIRFLGGLSEDQLVNLGGTEEAYDEIKREKERREAELQLRKDQEATDKMWRDHYHPTEVNYFDDSNVERALKEFDDK